MRIEERQHYSDGEFDRADERRQDKDWLESRLWSETARIYPIVAGRHLVQRDGTGSIRPVSIAADDVAGSGDVSEVVLLGIKNGTTYFSVTLPDHEGLSGAPGGEWHELRDVAADMDRFHGALLAYARGIAHWQAGHRYCGACGQPTASGRAGHVRKCRDESCGKTNFPRTDPAVITLVVDGPRCLLARRRVWPKGRRSTIAGFVEPGESLEDTVRREALEEVGVRIGKVGYQGSQPWPFPSSLMMGFRAEAVSTDIAVDGDEIEEADWYTPSEIARDVASGDLLLPPLDSISYWLISSWLQEQT